MRLIGLLRVRVNGTVTICCVVVLDQNVYDKIPRLPAMLSDFFKTFFLTPNKCYVKSSNS